MKEKNIGTSFDSWLDEEGIRQEVTANAIKRVLARQVAGDNDKRWSYEDCHGAENAHQSRTLDRLLDAENGSVNLSTLQKAPRL